MSEQLRREANALIDKWQGEGVMFNMVPEKCVVCGEIIPVWAKERHDAECRAPSKGQPRIETVGQLVDALLKLNRELRVGIWYDGASAPIEDIEVDLAKGKVTLG